MSARRGPASQQPHVWLLSGEREEPTGPDGTGTIPEDPEHPGRGGGQGQNG